MTQCDCSGIRDNNIGKHVYQAVCPMSDCYYESEWMDTVDKIIYDLTVHLWSTHDEEALAAYIASMLKEDPYDSHDDSRPYYKTKHVSK